MDPYVGEIRSFGFNFAPYGWAFCNGQLLPIGQNAALYAILGTTYGGNGQTTFGLPNLQGQVPMHWGNKAGFVTTIGEVQGTSTVTLSQAQLPMHTHQINAATASTGAERSAAPTNSSFLSASKGEAIYLPPPVAPNATFANNAITPNGGSQPHENMQPYLAINFCIALEGVFPSRN